MALHARRMESMLCEGIVDVRGIESLMHIYGIYIKNDQLKYFSVEELHTIYYEMSFPIKQAIAARWGMLDFSRNPPDITKY